MEETRCDEHIARMAKWLDTQSRKDGIELKSKVAPNMRDATAEDLARRYGAHPDLLTIFADMGYDKRELKSKLDGSGNTVVKPMMLSGIRSALGHLHNGRYKTDQSVPLRTSSSLSNIEGVAA